MRSGFALAALCALLCFPAEGFASQATKPAPLPAGGKFISLQAERNLAAGNKPKIGNNGQFLALNNRPKFFALRGRTAAGPALAKAPLSAAPLAAHEQPTKPAGSVATREMTREQAHQLLSIFAAAD